MSRCDLTRFPLASDHADEEVVGVAAVAEPFEVGVHRIDGRHFPPLLVDGFDLCKCSIDLGLIRDVGTEPFNFSAETEHAPFQRGIAREWAPHAAFVEVRFHYLHVLIELMQIDVGEQGRHNAALWRTTVRASVDPMFHVACFEHSSIRPMNLSSSIRFFRSPSRMSWSMLSKNPRTPTRPATCSLPGLLDGLESGMAGSARAEPMRLIEEHRFVDRFEQDPDRLLDEPVFHRGIPSGLFCRCPSGYKPAGLAGSDKYPVLPAWQYRQASPATCRRKSCHLHRASGLPYWRPFRRPARRDAEISSGDEGHLRAYPTATKSTVIQFFAGW
ncbi:hypothetical protein SAMN05216525_1234 [Bradyrhizobium sp. Gha]|nr:hypothetical protein SAMN05216525_1234 [Bradyrhizobium sp. Gha]